MTVHPMRMRILENKMQIPGMNKIQAALGKRIADTSNRFFKALWSSYLQQGTEGRTNLCYWADQFNNDSAFNIILQSLAADGWITTLTASVRNWAEGHLNENKLLEYVTPDELISVRVHKKYIHYAMTEEPEATECDLVRVNGQTKKTGLSAPGSMLAGNQPFYLDTEMLDQYREVIVQNFTKSMDKMKKLWPDMTSDRTTYDAISAEVLDYYIYNPYQAYTRGTSYLDSRGRAISSVLSKVGNPIGYKDIRACLRLPTVEVPLDVAS